ncbi:MAG TPA: PxxKW family cysteine-rich protein [Desulfuromonadales bacterium]|nr:PxxKW family cysteine-rich protein [Desulfuromonadales bacterium]
MKCQTVLPGTECNFWSKNGCIHEGGSCENVIEECEGCDRIVDGTIGPVCSAAPSPVKKWLSGLCNFATHRKVEVKAEEIKVNPLKASKRAGR